MSSIHPEDIRAGVAEGFRLYFEKHHEEFKEIFSGVATVFLEKFMNEWFEGYGEIERRMDAVQRSASVDGDL